jgi:uncharacterized protein (TIGR01777 family)
MRIAITGATGMVGTALSTALRRAGHQVVPVSRRPLPGGVLWNPERGEIDAAALAGVDAAVNLAGESLAAGRWTEALKARIVSSRVQGTRSLSETLAAASAPPRALISVSAIGYYGACHGDALLDESSPAGADFLARLCIEWEGAADPARQAGIRVVHPRFGLILATADGALAKMLPPFRLGLGGRLGTGSQWMSWITIDDVVSVLIHAITTDTLHGAVNGAAPTPVRNTEFTAVLADALHRPALLPMPAGLLRLLFGEMADMTLLASLRVSAEKLLASGFVFTHATLDGALQSLLHRR